MWRAHSSVDPPHIAIDSLRFSRGVASRSALSHPRERPKMAKSQLDSSVSFGNSHEVLPPHVTVAIEGAKVLS